MSNPLGIEPIILVPMLGTDEQQLQPTCGCGAANGAGSGGDCKCGSGTGSGA
jgi:hypothetical protein